MGMMVSRPTSLGLGREPLVRRLVLLDCCDHRALRPVVIGLLCAFALSGKCSLPLANGLRHGPEMNELGPLRASRFTIRREYLSTQPGARGLLSLAWAAWVALNVVITDRPLTKTSYLSC